MSACESAQQLNDVFENLTDKQHEVLALVGDNFTSKEIAFDLGISVSAVNQRIETVRARAGSLSRLELARAYREYGQGQDQERSQDQEQPQGREEAEEGRSIPPATPEQDHAQSGVDTNELAGEPDGACVDDATRRDCERWPGRDLRAGQLQIVRAQPPSAKAERAAVGLGGHRTVRWGEGALRGGKRTPGPVPALLDGHDARLGRMAAIVVIAFGLLLVSATGLGVLHSLAELF